MSATGPVQAFDASGNFINSFATNQAAVDAAPSGGTVLVDDGNYVDNVLISQAVTVLSVNGRGSTTITGISSAGALGSVQLANGANNVQIGGVGQGFRIVGIDNGVGPVENGTIYLQGSQDGFNLFDSEFEANGEHGLISRLGGTLTNAVIDGNEFSGQTFQSANPGGIGFSTQFSPGNNVPRQLVVMGEGGSGPTTRATSSSSTTRSPAPRAESLPTTGRPSRATPW